ncbi:uncharacterized protein EV420DRAFT_1558897 [Desarmillaria tabescens]|uniref:Uncharacterized protein n=1 Tax=Armillaria tabescens TaxID=1929756 RepID=A0AA39K2S6_ARMTA|nr:uncharacterized protein EV420DRAFT_1558897 [Desarmillaria tabescens]KAK0452109.1 hypothetical protein EV420DRAFT_1558897 [Desarmillaria tabescens]
MIDADISQSSQLVSRAQDISRSLVTPLSNVFYVLKSHTLRGFSGKKRLFPLSHGCASNLGSGCTSASLYCYGIMCFSSVESHAKILTCTVLPVRLSSLERCMARGRLFNDSDAGSLRSYAHMAVWYSFKWFNIIGPFVLMVPLVFTHQDMQYAKSDAR